VDGTSIRYVRKPNQISCFTPDDKPYGFTYGQWTAKWWEWILSIPAQINPLSDDTGRYAHVCQAGPVWFIAGTLGENKLPRRICTIPSDKSILFPVINYEANIIENPELENEHELVNHVINDMNDIVIREAIIDGIKVDVYRVRSDPAIFPVAVARDNPIGLPSRIVNIATDGHWVFLKPLQVGEHKIYFHGACSGGLRNSTAEYKLRVVYKK
jgi:hypothetical protein